MSTIFNLSGNYTFSSIFVYNTVPYTVPANSYAFIIEDAAGSAGSGGTAMSVPLTSGSFKIRVGTSGQSLYAANSAGIVFLFTTPNINTV